jgi:multidrug efflux pump subunit AcrB
MEKILRFFIKDKLLSNLILVLIFAAGLISAFTLKQEQMPAVDMDKMKISVVYPGASAKDVEMNSVVPIERELNNISGISEYNSISIESGASIFIDIDQDVSNKQSVKDEIYRKITLGNISDLPEEVEKIIIVDINPRLKTIFSISMTPKDVKKTSNSELFNFTNYVDKKLLRVKGVSDVRIAGYRDREIHIDIDPMELGKYYISLNDVVGSIQNRNIRSTGGTIQSIDRAQSIVTIGQFEDPMDVGDVIIRSGFEQKRVRIKDIGKVNDDFKKEIIRVAVNREKSIIFDVVKKEEADIVDTVKNIKLQYKELAKNYGHKYNFGIVFDESRSIISLLNVVISNAAMGFVLVLIILLIFLDLKTSFWTAMGIPISLMIVLIYMNNSDISLNILSLGAVITMLGILVDDGIIIAEVIYEKRSQGLNPVEAAVQGVLSVIKPVVVAILTTIVAFLPMLSITGSIGRFLMVFPVIVVAILLASLFEATIMLPVHLAYSKQKDHSSDENWFKPVTEKYGQFLEIVLKYRYIVVLSFVIFLVFSIAISQNSIKNFVMMYDKSSEIIYVNMEAPKGFSLESTEKMVKPIEALVLKNIPAEDRVSMVTTIGQHTSSHIFSQGNKENLAEIKISMIPSTDRKKMAVDYALDLKKIINKKLFPKFDSILVKEKKKGPPTGAAVNVKIIGTTDKDAGKIQLKLEKFLKNIPGVINVDNDQKESKQELKIVFDYNKLADYGMNVASVAQTVRTAYEGNVATSIQVSGANEKLDFRVRVDEKFHKNRYFLENLQVPNNQGRLLKLKEISKIKLQNGKGVINHYNGQKVITVTADVNEEITTSMRIMKMIKKNSKSLLKGYNGSYFITGGESKDTKKSMGDLGSAFLMALLFIYFIMIFLFRSFSQPLLVLAVVPFGIIGALLAFTAHGIPLSFFGAIGVIGLSGVVVNDSIVMVDFINNIFKNSKEGEDSVITKVADGAKKRLRPVILTTITTVAGLMPTVYGIGGDAGMLVPTVMGMAYGILFATTLVLILLPALYMVNVDVKGGIGKIKLKVKGVVSV